MNFRTTLGVRGEEAAVRYLIKKGYKIIERNFKRSWGEIDIIARTKDKVLAFVEVKTMSVSSDDGLKPENQMTRGKLKRFSRAASLYAGSHSDLINDQQGWRLDVLALTVDGKDFSIKHYQNITVDK
ncbi:YraN family protein [Candidatus Jorgensenbacteria bacterium]|nr:YraN family protein [Candidatus Jorgensenbacteria bacterium]